jgi:L-threonylcarbamoyladenylate synthase
VIVSVERAAELLEGGAVVAYPTETVYGLGADPCQPEALDELRALKGRSAERGLSLLVRDVNALALLVPALPARARALAEAFWPGPLTLVVGAVRTELAPVATDRGVGFRCSSHPTAAALAGRLPGGVVATSCNKTGEPPCCTAAEVESVFGSTLPIAGGEPAGELSPSTVVAVDAAGELSLLRAGALDFAAVEAAA